MEVLVSTAPGAASVIKMDRDTEVARGLDAALLDRGCAFCAWCGATVSHSHTRHSRTHARTRPQFTHTRTRTHRRCAGRVRAGDLPTLLALCRLGLVCWSRNSMASAVASPRRKQQRAGAGSEVDGTSSLSRPGAQVHACQVSSMPMHWAITLARRRKPRPPPPVSDSPPLHRATRVAVETRRRCQ